MTPLPVKLAKDVLEAYDLKQVIVLCMDKEGTHHFITYGQDKENCREAGSAADSWKRAFHWPKGSLSRYSKKEARNPPNHGKPWNVAEDLIVTTMAETQSDEAIGRELGRSRYAVKGRRHHLDLWKEFLPDGTFRIRKKKNNED